MKSECHDNYAVKTLILYRNYILRKKNFFFCIRFSVYFFKVFLFFLQLVSEKLENFEPRATGVLSRSETVQSACSEKEYDAVKRAASKFRLQWNNLNQVRYTRYQLKFNILLFIK